MKAKYLILGLLNIIIWVLILLYHTKYEYSPFLGGVGISFSLSTIIGVLGSLQVVFISSFLAWALYFLAAFEGYPSTFLAGCAVAVTIGVVTGFIMSRPI
jgi:hypothetical protein